MALKDITLGQYFPGHSLVHRLDPRTKILAVILYIVALFLADSFLTYAIVFGVLALSVGISTVPVRSLVRGLKPVVFILIFYASLLNLFYTPGDHVLGSVLDPHHHLGRGNQCLLHGNPHSDAHRRAPSCSLYHLPHSSHRWAGIPAGSPEKNQGPRPRAVHDHVHRPAVYSPLSSRRRTKLCLLSGPEGPILRAANLIQRAKALIPLLVPLFISAFRRADELATAHGVPAVTTAVEGRTRLRQLRYAGRDWGGPSLFFLLVTVGIGVLGHLGL